MRRSLPCVGVVVAAVVAACGPVDTGSGSTGGSGDGGPVWTGGGGAPDGGPAADGGTGGGGGDTDAGTPDGGTGGGGGGGPQAACDGIVPTQSPPAVSVVAPHAKGEVCWYLTTDATGTVGVESHSGNDAATWHLWSPTGAEAGSFTARFDVYGEPSGFEGSFRDGDSTYLGRWSASGAEQRRTLLGGPGCQGESFLSMTGGTLVLGGCTGGALNASIFDADGNLAVTRAVADKAQNAVGLVDAQGKVLVTVWPGNGVGLKGATAARWFDAQLNPTTDWFEVPGNGDRPFVRPLIGGGAAIRAGNDWVAVIASGAARWDPPPDWLASHPVHDVQIVRGGRAYVLVPKFGANAPRNQLELYDPAGNRCGAGTFPAEGLSVGMDGTVIGSGGEAGCSTTWWPGVLR